MAQKVGKKPATVKKAKKSAIADKATQPEVMSAPIEVSVPAKKKTVVKKAAAPAATSYVVIDYPVEGESIQSAFHYAIKIGASHDGAVEISFNGKEWQPCRHNSGYWWYDLWHFENGPIKVAARLIDGNGNVIKKSIIKKCLVI